MTEADLWSLFFDVNQDIDTQFQFWISITFAVLVASFVADERLSRVERRVISALYLIAATIILLRYTSALAHQAQVLGLFTANGFAQPARPDIVGVLRFGLFTIGSFIAAASVVFPRFGVKGVPADGRRDDG